MKGSLWGLSIVSMLVILGSVAIDTAVPGSAAESTQAVADALEPISTALLVVLLLTTVGVVMSTLRRSF